MNHEIVHEVSTWKAESLKYQTFPVLIDNLAFQLSKYIPVPWRLEDIEEQMISLYFHQFKPSVNPLPHGRKTHHGGGCTRLSDCSGIYSNRRVNSIVPVYEALCA